MIILMMALGMMMMTKMLMLLPLQTMTNTKRLLVYIVPVTVLSFSLNIPKFMEVVIYMFKFTEVSSLRLNQVIIPKFMGAVYLNFFKILK